MRTCLIIGHKQTATGASNKTYGAKEFDVNEAIVKKLQLKLNGGVRITELTEVIPVYRKTSFKQLPNEINLHDPKFAISFHCNAFNTRASGSETLYYHTSKNGKAMANICQKHFSKTFGINDRGIKPKHAEDRGGYILRYTKCPIVLCEPFFIDNDTDYEIVIGKGIDQIVNCYIDIIKDITQLFI